MFKNRILEDLKTAIENLGYKDTDIVLSIPKNPEFGEYTTNIALQLAKQKQGKDKQSPIEIAKEIVEKLQRTEDRGQYLEKIEVAGGGFINFFIKPDALLESLSRVCDYSSLVNPEVEVENEQKKKIFMEYSQPNTHKLFHIGHTRGASLGESISRLLEADGNKVFRATYGSDIGLPVAKAIWGILQICHAELVSASKSKILKQVQDDKLDKKQEFLGKAYALGAKMYEEDEVVKAQINGVNKLLYQKDPSVIPLWEGTRQWSIDYFEQLYQILDIKFNRSFWESEVEAEGKKLVEDNLDKVFISDQEAIIFPGEEYGLHNRVFVTTAGHPTYEAKDLRLAKLKMEIWPFDLSIIQSGSEQTEYFKVMFKALEKIDESFKDKMVNIPYGMVNLTSGKMSSRSGEVITFDWLFDEIKRRVKEVMNSPRHSGLDPESQNRSRNEFGMTKEEKDQVIYKVGLGAIKFSMLKYAPQTDITFDIEKSVSLSGDSGPYIQYSYSRAKSVLRNAQFNYDVDLPHSDVHPKSVGSELEKEERLILQKIEHFQSVISEAALSLHPNIVANYLIELSALFNLFYQKYPIIKADGQKAELRLALTCSVAVILKQGLYLLGIEAPERM